MATKVTELKVDHVERLRDCLEYIRNDAAHGEAKKSLDALAAENETLRAALTEIRDHPHNSYENTNSVDVTDGHRCAATIARAALKGEETK